MNRKIFYCRIIAILLLSGCATTDKPLPPEISQQQQEQEEQQRQEQLQQNWLSWHQQWIGTPHRFGGNNHRGIDCSSYVQQGYRELYNIDLPRTAKMQRKQGSLVSITNLQIGDLVFFRPDTYPNHVGIYMGDQTFIHVSSKKGVTRSQLNKGYWHRYFLEGRRIPR